MRRVALAGFLASVLCIAGTGAAAAFDGKYSGDVAGSSGGRAKLVYRDGRVASFEAKRIRFSCIGRSDRHLRPPAFRDVHVARDGRFTARKRGRSQTYRYHARLHGRMQPERGSASGDADWHLRYRNGDVCVSRPRHARWKLRDPKLLFASGFEPPVAIGEPKVELGNWRSAITGGDLGFPWDGGLLGGGRPNFLTLLPADETPGNYYVTSLDQGFGVHHSTALFQAVGRDAKFDGGRVRNQFPVRWPGKRGYVSYMLKLQSGGAASFDGRKSWRRVMEWGTGGTDREFRIVLEVRGGPQGTAPRWNVAGLQLTKRDDGGTSTQRLWDFFPESPAPQFGRWSHIEVQWFQHPTDGTFKVWIDGQEIADYHGQTRGPIHLTPQIFKIYAGADVLGHGPQYQWIDDVALARRRLHGDF
jgi:hypothetical protein